MNRRDAHALIDGGRLTWGELKKLLQADTRSPRLVSVVNPGMSHGQAVGILVAGIAEREDADIVAGPKSQTPLKDRLAATNVLRECGGAQ